MESSFFTKQKLRDYYIFIQRFGTQFLTYNNQNNLGLENFVTNCVEKVKI